jgi:hypothetical protein
VRRSGLKAVCVEIIYSSAGLMLARQGNPTNCINIRGLAEVDVLMSQKIHTQIYQLFEIKGGFRACRGLLPSQVTVFFTKV